MLKTIEELRLIECAAVATPPGKLLLTNEKGEVIASELERILGSKEIYTVNDLSKEARKVLQINV